MYEWFVYMYVCVSCAYGDHKRMSDPPELELRMVVSHCVGVEN